MVSRRLALPRALWSALALLVGLFGALGVAARPAWALLGQTASDLAVMEDELRHALEQQPGLKERMLPTLLAPPAHHWVESRVDFGAAATKILTGVFNGPSDVIACPDCDTWRLHVEEGQQLLIVNGEPSLAELGRIRQDPRYDRAKSLTLVKETPSGVELSIVDLTDGRVLAHVLADASAKLTDVRPYLHYAEERERRLAGESLSYVFLNLGLYPKGLVQAEFVEQWGDRNQHISGVGLSLLNPNFALGGVYHYLFHNPRKLHASVAVYYPLTNALQSAFKSTQSPTTAFVAQGMIQYAIGNSYAVFASVSTEGNLSIGFNFYNPLILPFLL
jgi:hypothetical protein